MKAGSNIHSGATLVEMLVTLGTSAIILGALAGSAMSLRGGIHSTEVYAGAYARQQRLSDFLGRDMRRAIQISITDENGNAAPVGQSAVHLEMRDRAELLLKIPGYYANAEGTDNAPLEVVAGTERLDYGSTASTLAEPVVVRYRKIFVAAEQCICFVREEAGQQSIILRNAEEYRVYISLAVSMQSGVVQTEYRSQSKGAKPLVTTSDYVLLRNIASALEAP